MKTRYRRILGGGSLFAAFALAVLAQGPASIPDPVRKAVLKNCAVSGCHIGAAPAAKANFEPDKLLASTLDVPSRQKPELKIIDSAAPEKSYLLMKIRGDKDIGGRRMPLNGTPLKEAEFKAFSDWIMGMRVWSPKKAASDR